MKKVEIERIRAIERGKRKNHLSVDREKILKW